MTLGRFGKFIANGVTLLFLRQRNSMTALFMCEHRAGLKNLVDLYAFGKLQSVLEEFFTSLLVADDPQVTVNIKSLVWELSDYCRCSLYFSPLPQRKLFTNDNRVETLWDTLCKCTLCSSHINLLCHSLPFISLNVFVWLYVVLE